MFNQRSPASPGGKYCRSVAAPAAISTYGDWMAESVVIWTPNKAVSHRASTSRLKPIAALRALTMQTTIHPTCVHENGCTRQASSAPVTSTMSSTRSPTSSSQLSRQNYESSRTQRRPTAYRGTSLWPSRVRSRHSPSTVAWSAVGRPPGPLTQDSCVFFERQALCPPLRGVVVSAAAAALSATGGAMDSIASGEIVTSAAHSSAARRSSASGWRMGRWVRYSNGEAGTMIDEDSPQ